MANKLLMRHIKRLFDLAVAIPSVIILSPVLDLIGFFCANEDRAAGPFPAGAAGDAWQTFCYL
jgi:lipopolysaccharide/colanic/teichoic acid biosynthesis glycosyltransferase